MLEHSRVVEMGQHTDLLVAGGRYAQLYQAQMQLGQELGSPEPPRELPPPLPEREEVSVSRAVVGRSVGSDQDNVGC